MKGLYEGLPDASPIDAVRLHIGDTNLEDLYFSDKEIEFFISEREGNVLEAASDAADALAAKFAADVDSKVGDLAVSASHRFKHFSALATRLRVRAAVKAAKEESEKTPPVKRGPVPVWRPPASRSAFSRSM